MRNTERLFEFVVKNNNYGFYELAKDCCRSMREFYEEKYYQNNYGMYKEDGYENLDIARRKMKYTIKEKVVDVLSGGAQHSCQRTFLDIGSGEGYALAYFSSHDWNVLGIDFSSYGIKRHNPDMEKYFLQGDFSKLVEELQRCDKRFDFINADNVLEHLPDSTEFFSLLRPLCHEDTLCCITVPNDFSLIQCLAYDMGEIDDAFWVTKETSEHFSYFSLESLTKLGEAMGYKKVMALADWPIDFFLLHEASNYQKNNQLGHACHVACARLEQALFEKSSTKMMKLLSSMAELGIGRHVSVFFKLA